MPVTNCASDWWSFGSRCRRAPGRWCCALCAHSAHTPRRSVALSMREHTARNGCAPHGGSSFLTTYSAFIRCITFIRLSISSGLIGTPTSAPNCRTENTNSLANVFRNGTNCLLSRHVSGSSTRRRGAEENESEECDGRGVGADELCDVDDEDARFEHEDRDRQRR